MPNKELTAAAVNTYFRISAGVIFIACLSKLVSALGNDPVLHRADPLLWLTNRDLFLVLGIAELPSAVLLCFSRRLWLKALVALFLGSNFLFYRVAIWVRISSGACPCFGRLTQSLGLGSAVVDSVSWAFVVSLIVAGGVVLWQERWRMELENRKSTNLGALRGPQNAPRNA